MSDWYELTDEKLAYWANQPFENQMRVRAGPRAICLNDVCRELLKAWEALRRRLTELNGLLDRAVNSPTHEVKVTSNFLVQPIKDTRACLPEHQEPKP